MAFCRYCGRELEDGEVCSCRQETTTSTEAPSESPVNGSKAAPSAEQVKSIALNVWSKFVALLKAPATGSAAYVHEGDLTASISFIVVHALCSAIFAALWIGKLNGIVAMGGSFTSSLKFSGVGAFFQTIAYSLILAVILAGLFMGGAKLLHVQLRFQEALAIASMRSVISIPVVLVSCILMLFSAPVGVVCFYGIGALAAACFLMLAGESIGNLSRDRKAYLVTAVIVVFVVVFALLAKLVLKNYIPSNIGNLFSFGSMFR